MKKPYILYLAIIFCFPLIAQTIVTTSGGNAIGSGGSVSYTVGQIVVTTINGSNGSVNHGVQQPIEFFTLDVVDYLDTDFGIKTYPNPTSDNLQLSIENLNSNVLSISLYDIYGRIQLHQKINEKETIVAMHTLPSAIYFLKITESNRIVKTVKIIKK